MPDRQSYSSSTLRDSKVVTHGFSVHRTSRHRSLDTGEELIKGILCVNNSFKSQRLRYTMTFLRPTGIIPAVKIRSSILYDMSLRTASQGNIKSQEWRLAGLSRLTPNGVVMGKAVPESIKVTGRQPCRAFSIFIDTLCEGAVPAVRDENDNPCVFPTRLLAEREIADNMITRLQEFMDGEREFEDAITVEEYVVEVDVLADGVIVDSAGNRLASRL
jgi:hypothetical protein